MTEPIIKVTPEEWDAQYRAGSWDYLKGITAHYAVIGSLIKKYKCRMVLDVGSGDGLLREFLPAVKGAYYGIDVSTAAVLSANCEFMVTAVCAAEDFVTHTNWDCAVFCESLYYMPAPLEMLARYFQFSKIIFISIVHLPKMTPLIQSIRDRFKVVEDFELYNCSESKIGGWKIMAVKP